MRSRDRNVYEVHGDVFFVTTTIIGFIKLFTINELCDIVINTLKFYQDRGDFKIIAYVIMPNHIHLILKIYKDKTISSCMGNLKRYSSKQITKWLEENKRTDLLKKLNEVAIHEPTPDSKIWKYRFDSFIIINEHILRQKTVYIHNNPERAGLVSQPEDWYYSSMRNYLENVNNPLNIDFNWTHLSSGRDS